MPFSHHSIDPKEARVIRAAMASESLLVRLAASHTRRAIECRLAGDTLTAQWCLSRAQTLIARLDNASRWNLREAV